jgi:hypothetical protein
MRKMRYSLDYAYNWKKYLKIVKGFVRMAEPLLFLQNIHKHDMLNLQLGWISKLVEMVIFYLILNN